MTDDPKTAILASLSKINEITKMIAENDGEISPELEHILISNSLELPHQVDQMVDILDGLEERSAWLKNRMDLYAKMHKSIESALFKIRTSAALTMDLAGKPEVQGNEWTAYLKKSPPSVCIIDLAKVPDEFFVEKREVSKSAIKNAIYAGEEVPGAKLINNSYLATRVKR